MFHDIEISTLCILSVFFLVTTVFMIRYIAHIFHEVACLQRTYDKGRQSELYWLNFSRRRH